MGGGDITPSLYLNWVWGGISPPVRETVEKGVDFPPGGDIPPLCLYGLGQPVDADGSTSASITELGSTLGSTTELETTSTAEESIDISLKLKAMWLQCGNDHPTITLTITTA